MMSSDWTFRLNLRSAFSKDSPSCNRISATLTLLNWCDRISYSRALQPHNLFHHGKLSHACKFQLFGDVVAWGGLLRPVRFLRTEIEERGLLCGVFAQFGHLVHAAWNGLFLFALIPALSLVPLSLLPRVFLLALCEC